MLHSSTLTVFLYFHLSEKIERTVQIEASTVEIEERGVKLRLTVVDTPGYGDAINSQDWCVFLLHETVSSDHSWRHISCSFHTLILLLLLLLCSLCLSQISPSDSITCLSPWCVPMCRSSYCAS